jgi:hypothetical protein
MDLLNFFRRGADAGWVCKRAAKLTVDSGRTVRLRPGQVIYTGDFRFHGQDLALALDMLLGPMATMGLERPQSIGAALAA